MPFRVRREALAVRSTDCSTEDPGTVLSTHVKQLIHTPVLGRRRPSSGICRYLQRWLQGRGEVELARLRGRQAAEHELLESGEQKRATQSYDGFLRAPWMRNHTQFVHENELPGDTQQRLSKEAEGPAKLLGCQRHGGMAKGRMLPMTERMPDPRAHIN